MAWEHPLKGSHPLGEAFHSDFAIAEERGRRMAAEAVRVDPATKARVEAAFGRAECARRWPEAYAKPVIRWHGFGRVFGGLNG
jgi:type 1 glutamine amidotransferase